MTFRNTHLGLPWSHGLKWNEIQMLMEIIKDALRYNILWLMFYCVIKIIFTITTIHRLKLTRWFTFSREATIIFMRGVKRNDEIGKDSWHLLSFVIVGRMQDYVSPLTGLTSALNRLTPHTIVMQKQDFYSGWWF